MAGKPLFLQGWGGSGSEASSVAEGSVRWASAGEMRNRSQICKIKSPSSASTPKYRTVGSQERMSLAYDLLLVFRIYRMGPCQKTGGLEVGVSRNYQHWLQ